MSTTALIMSILIMLIPIPFLWKYGVSTVKVRRSITGILITVTVIAIVYLVSAL